MEKKIYPEEIYKVYPDSYKDYTLDEIQILMIKSFEEVIQKFGGTHKNFTVSLENDYSNCYYEGDSPSLVLQFKGIKQEGGKKRN